MEALFTYGFLIRGLFAGVFIALACAILGVFLILRKDAMIGHGLSHVAFAGVALGLYLHIMPLPVALAVSIGAAIGITKLKEKAGLYGDTAIGILSSFGMAVGILLATLAQSFNVDLLAYLFGDILAIETFEVWLSVGLAVLILAAVFVNYPKLMFSTFDRESARVSGVKIERLDSLIMVLTAVTLVLGMKVVGILLVAALVVIPAAAGLQLATNFRTALLASAATATGSVVAGLALALELDVPASAAIVILCFAVFILSSFLRKKNFLLGR